MPTDNGHQIDRDRESSSSHIDKAYALMRTPYALMRIAGHKAYALIATY